MTDHLEIDQASVFDNLDERQVEFAGAIDDESIQFAARHDLLEALSGERPDGNGVALFSRHVEAITAAALVALGRDRGQEMVVISENDLA